jgi:hypothetical protein
MHSVSPVLWRALESLFAGSNMKNMELSRRMRFLSLALIAAGALSCQGKERPFADTVPAAGGTDGNPTAVGLGGTDPGGAVGTPPGCEGPACPSQPEQIEPIGGVSGTGVDPTQAAAGSADAGIAVTCLDGSTESCGPAAEEGTCKFGTRTCTAGAWGECVGAVFGGAGAQNAASSFGACTGSIGEVASAAAEPSYRRRSPCRLPPSM